VPRCKHHLTDCALLSSKQAEFVFQIVPKELTRDTFDTILHLAVRLVGADVEKLHFPAQSLHPTKVFPEHEERALDRVSLFIGGTSTIDLQKAARTMLYKRL
jgi:hypothetical protein